MLTDKVIFKSSIALTGDEFLTPNGIDKRVSSGSFLKLPKYGPTESKRS